MIATWHAHIAQDELREERQVETHEHEQRRQLRPSLGIELSCYLRPPEMQPCHVGQHHATHHDVMEVCHHEVGIGNVNVYSDGRQEHARQSANRKQADKSECIQHGRVIRDRALVQRGGPVEDLHRGRNRHQVCEQREHQCRIYRDASHKHVVCPHQEAQYRDGD